MSAPLLTIRPADPREPDARLLVDRLSQALSSITGDSGESSFDPADVLVAGALFVIARDRDGQAVGCGAYRPFAPGIAELKRIYAVPGTSGTGAAVLAYLERQAEADGYSELWLETRIVSDRAIRFYERHGFVRIANFGKYRDRPEAACFAKRCAPIESEAFDQS